MAVKAGAPDGRSPERRAPPVGLVLAGGASRRMGRDKARLPFGGRSLAAHAADILGPVADPVYLSAPDRERYRDLGLPVLPDLFGGRGPLDGVAAALRLGDVLVLACDMPFVPTAFFRALLALSPAAAGAMYRGRRAEPLAALYRREALSRAEEVLAGEDWSMAAFVEALDVRFVGDGDLRELGLGPDAFTNLNDRAAYERALRRWERDARDSGRGGGRDGPRP